MFCISVLHWIDCTSTNWMRWELRHPMELTNSTWEELGLFNREELESRRYMKESARVIVTYINCTPESRRLRAGQR